jgi:hypothetical protein
MNEEVARESVVANEGQLSRLTLRLSNDAQQSNHKAGGQLASLTLQVCLPRSG